MPEKLSGLRKHDDSGESVSPSDSDSNAVRASSCQSMTLTRRSLMQSGALAIVGTVAGCVGWGNDPDSATNVTVSPTDGTTSEEGGRGVPASGGISIRNSASATYEVSVVVTEQEDSNYENLPTEFTPTTSSDSRSPLFQTQVRISPDSDRSYQEVFPVPEKRVAYRAVITLNDGTATGYMFENYPHSGFINLGIDIWPGPDIIVGSSYTRTR